jgi:hypothetical protein
VHAQRGQECVLDMGSAVDPHVHSMFAVIRTLRWLGLGCNGLRLGMKWGTRMPYGVEQADAGRSHVVAGLPRCPARDQASGRLTALLEFVLRLTPAGSFLHMQVFCCDRAEKERDSACEL